MDMRKMISDEKFMCPHCHFVYEDALDYLEPDDNEGSFTMYCENHTCQKEFSVDFETEIVFKTGKL